MADEIQEVGREKLAGLKWNAAEHFELGYWSDKSAAEAVEWAAEQLFGIGINSTDRGPKLIDLLARLWMSDKHKWSIFQSVWPTCDQFSVSLFEDFEECFTEGTRGWAYLSGKDLAFFESLPNEVRVYRGASRSTRNGWSWTTELVVAKSFATGHRGVAVENAAIYQGIVSKRDIWTVFTERGESEIFVPPQMVRGLRARRRA